MATVTASYNWVSGETVTPTKLNSAATPTVVVADGEITSAKISDGAVTQAKLSSNVTLVPAGAVMPFAMNSAPSGWLPANGSAVSRSTYAALFAVIGTAYGVGNGSTTFNVPDLRGYFVRGWGTNSDGTASGNFASKQAHAFLNHSHAATCSTNGAHTHSVNASTSAGASAFGASGGGGTLTTDSDGDHSHTITVAASTAGGTETRPANIALLYCIKF